MAKPNYSFAKRQRDLAKKQKKEEKRQRKIATQPAAPPADSPGSPLDVTTTKEIEAEMTTSKPAG